jgi:hypothetical protein
MSFLHLPGPGLLERKLGFSHGHAVSETITQPKLVECMAANEQGVLDMLPRHGSFKIGRVLHLHAAISCLSRSILCCSGAPKNVYVMAISVRDAHASQTA